MKNWTRNTKLIQIKNEDKYFDGKPKKNNVSAYEPPSSTIFYFALKIVGRHSCCDCLLIRFYRRHTDFSTFFFQDVLCWFHTNCSFLSLILGVWCHLVLKKNKKNTPQKFESKRAKKKKIEWMKCYCVIYFWFTFTYRDRD